MNIQSTIYITKCIYNWLYTYPNDYTIDYTRSQMAIQSTIYIDKWLYNWLCTYQMTIQLTMYTDKWLYNWLYTQPNDYTIDYIHRQMAI